jgi:hypothetical protein
VISLDESALPLCRCLAVSAEIRIAAHR